jgi:hypothetical protein
METRDVSSEGNVPKALTSNSAEVHGWHHPVPRREDGTLQSPENCETVSVSQDLSHNRKVLEFLHKLAA